MGRIGRIASRIPSATRPTETTATARFFANTARRSSMELYHLSPNCGHASVHATHATIKQNSIARNIQFEDRAGAVEDVSIAIVYHQFSQSTCKGGMCPEGFVDRASYVLQQEGNTIGDI